MEDRLLGLELFPEFGNAAFEFIPQNTLAKNFHLPLLGDRQDVPPPSTRAEFILSAFGILPPADDPMLSLIERYREVDPIYARMCLADDDAAADAYYEAHVEPAREEIAFRPPAITTEGGARECIRAALEEQCIFDGYPHSLLKAALAFLDGRAVR